MSAPIVAALGKKLKRRQIGRSEWRQIRMYVREQILAGHFENARKVADIVDRHAPGLYDQDPLTNREHYLARFAPFGRVDAVRHMIRTVNGRRGIGNAYPSTRSMHIRGYHDRPQMGRLPDARRVA